MPKLLTTESLRERVRGILRSQIMTGEIVPGSLYSVSQFAETLGVSPTPVREAVLDLANSGLLEIRRNRGFVVPEVTETGLEELHRIRALLEIPSMVDASKRMRPGDLEACRALAEKTIVAAASGNLIEWIESDRRFHSAYLQPLGMPHLVSLIMTYRDRARLRGLRSKMGSAELVKSASEHVTFVDLAASGESDKLKELITQHIEQTRIRWRGDAARSSAENSATPAAPVTAVTRSDDLAA